MYSHTPRSVCVGVMMKEHNKLCFKAAATCTCKCWLHSVTRIVVKRCANPLGKLPAEDILSGTIIDNKLIPLVHRCQKWQ